MERISLAIIGSGWRAYFFMRCVKALPHLFEVCGVVTTNEEKKANIEETFGFKVYHDISCLMAAEKPEYAVVSVKASAAAEVTCQLAAMHVPVLLETPAPLDMPGLAKDAKVQMAEQYFLRPMQQAHLNYIASGRLGDMVQARISFCNDYHAVSLIRKYLNIGFENCTIKAQSFMVPGYPGYERDGLYQDWTLKDREQVFATLDFGGKLGIYDYETMQHRSFIRSQFTQLKGTKGEIMNSEIRYMTAPDRFMTSSITRQEMGIDTNIEGNGLKAITGDGLHLYTNPYLNSGLNDDEIAVAKCMEKMGDYVRTGESFYSLQEGMQDMYLSQLIARAIKTGQSVTSETQPFAMR